MKKLKKIIACFLIFIFLPVYNVSAEEVQGSDSSEQKWSSADNIILRGSAAGLVDTLGDAPFLRAENMLPGDSVRSKLLIRNDYKYPYRITLTGRRVENPQEKNYDFENNFDLMNMIRVKIYYEGEDKVLYNNTLFDEHHDTISAEIDLGEFEPGDMKQLVAEATFEPEMDYNYMNKALVVEWVFYAERVGNGDNPSNSEPKSDSSGGNNYNPVINNIINITDPGTWSPSGFSGARSSYGGYFDDGKGVVRSGEKAIMPYIIACAVAFLVIIAGTVFLIIKRNKGEKEDEDKYKYKK